MVFYSSNPESWWASRLLNPKHKTDGKSPMKEERGQPEAWKMREDGVRMSLLRWTRWCQGRTCNCEFVPCGAYRVLCTHVNQSLTQFLRIGLGSFPILLMEKLSVKESAHSLAIITQQVQGKDRIRASKPQRQTAWPHHFIHPGFGYWIKRIKRDNVIERLEYRLWTQIGTESHFMNEEIYDIMCRGQGMRFRVRGHAFKFLIPSLPL